MQKYWRRYWRQGFWPWAVLLLTIHFSQRNVGWLQLLNSDILWTAMYLFLYPTFRNWAAPWLRKWTRTEAQTASRQRNVLTTVILFAANFILLVTSPFCAWLAFWHQNHKKD
ncbi:hypothetical protein IV38_GL001189 [Lactobacillus selangorensis]|uniref:Uncharacterized protein n=1 Tax=Lactobacillus selangorensis TaxID=81857 RepID=A0A0R2FZF4_9LACO|nr:hypothetical protein [Lactobacillus selangorensis]KRN28976.1 hypothetical protein IV38_GL001189 [Lactobacillus selangorensis]KRN32614.1 hypothetical protein IV40_GL000664 [Lactobacillus selangorensis]